MAPAAPLPGPSPCLNELSSRQPPAPRSRWLQAAENIQSFELNSAQKMQAWFLNTLDEELMHGAAGQEVLTPGKLYAVAKMFNTRPSFELLHRTNAFEFNNTLHPRGWIRFGTYTYWYIGSKLTAAG
jgi:hypothetical protein